jgi:hypothetical protein
MDADDIAFPDRLAEQLAFMEKHPEVDLLGCGAIAFQGAFRAIGKFDVKDQHRAICGAPELGFVLAHPTWFGRRNWYVRFRYREDARRAQDQELLLRARRASSFANLPAPLLGYRQETPKVRHMLGGRWTYTKALWREARSDGNWALAARGTVLQALRGAVAITAVVLGYGRNLLTNRFLPLTEEDQTRWDCLIASLALHTRERRPQFGAAEGSDRKSSS